MANEDPKMVSLIQRLYGYVEAKAELAKMYIVEKTATLVSAVLTAFILIVLVGVGFFFLNIAIAFMLGEWFNSPTAGFAFVAGFYILLGIILLAFSKKLIYKPLINLFINILYKDDGDGQDKNK